MNLCKNLSLSIEKIEDAMGDEEIKIILVDRINLQQAEICYPVSVTTLPSELMAHRKPVPTQKSRKYNLKEALVIAMRHLIDEAVDSGMINLTPPGGPMKLRTPLDESFPG
jgi:hypothetical protein